MPGNSKGPMTFSPATALPDEEAYAWRPDFDDEERGL
jgi:hypothetical protein